MRQGSGYKCECGSHESKITDCRQHQHGKRRRRVCEDCGKKVFTIELTESKLENLIKFRQAYMELKKKTDKAKLAYARALQD